MKKAIKIALATMTIMFVLLASMHWFKSHQEEKRLIRQEQERMVEYTLENYEDVKKIEFTNFEKKFFYTNLVCIYNSKWRYIYEL